MLGFASSPSYISKLARELWNQSSTGLGGCLGVWWLTNYGNWGWGVHGLAHGNLWSSHVFDGCSSWEIDFWDGLLVNRSGWLGLWEVGWLGGDLCVGLAVRFWLGNSSVWGFVQGQLEVVPRPTSLFQFLDSQSKCQKSGWWLGLWLREYPLSESIRAHKMKLIIFRGFEMGWAFGYCLPSLSWRVIPGTLFCCRCKGSVGNLIVHCFLELSIASSKFGISFPPDRSGNSQYEISQEHFEIFKSTDFVLSNDCCSHLCSITEEVSSGPDQ